MVTGLLILKSEVVDNDDDTRTVPIEGLRGGGGDIMGVD